MTTTTIIDCGGASGEATGPPTEEVTPVANLTTAGLLDEIMARIPDNSVEMRRKCLVWLNEAMRLIVDYPRTWRFLQGVNTSVLPYGDDLTTTIFPPECGRVLKRAVLTVAYEVDKDPSATASLMLDEAEMSLLKSVDNRRKSIPAFGRYLRETVNTAVPVPSAGPNNVVDGGTF